MKRVIFVFLWVVGLSCLLGTPLEDFIRETGRELVRQVESKQPLVLVMDWPEIQAEGQKATEELSLYFREILQTELSKSEKIKILDFSRTDPILKELAGVKRDYEFFNELGRRIHSESNLVPDALLEYQVLDLDSQIKIRLTVVDSQNFMELALVSAEYPADEQTDKLLGKKRKKAERHHKSPRSGPNTFQSEAGKVVWREDFASYPEGEPLPDMGRNLVVLKGKMGRKYAGSLVRGKHQLSREMAFPENFSFEVAFNTPVQSPVLTFMDNRGDEVGITMKYNRWNGRLTVSITGSVKKTVPCDDINTLKVTREKGTFKVYVNGQYLLSGVYENFGKVSGFNLDLHQGQLYTDFLVQKL